MDFLLKFAVIWLSTSIVIIATGWYAIAAIKPRFPNWWKRVVVDDDPFHPVSNPSIATAKPTHADSLLVVQVESTRFHQPIQK